MKVMVLLQIAPSITDWIQAAGVMLGVPLTVWSIYKLFKASKSKDKKLEELQNQTETLRIHNNLVKESNVIQKEQLELLRDSISGGTQQNAKYEELVEKSRKIDFKPYFRTAGGMSDRENIKMNLKNIGENAVMDKPEIVENEFVWVKFQYQTGSVVESEKLIAIELKTKNRENSFRDNNVAFKIYFSNMHGDKYFQQVTFTQKRFEIGIPQDL